MINPAWPRWRYHQPFREARVGKSTVSLRIFSDYEYRYKLVAIKLITASKEHLEKHYADLSEKPFFKGLVTCTFRPSAVTETSDTDPQ